MSVLNKTRGTLIAKHLMTLNANCIETLRFLNRRGIPRNCALWIAPCRAIYTIGMKNPVDIAFLNQHGRIVTMFKNFPPDCIADSSRDAVSSSASVRASVTMPFRRDPSALRFPSRSGSSTRPCHGGPSL